MKEPTETQQLDRGSGLMRPPPFVMRCACLQVGSVGTGEGDVQKCKKTSCGRFYHPECVEGDECTRVFKVQAKFLCPQVRERQGAAGLIASPVRE